MKFRKVLSASLALLLAASLPLSALAETYDLAKGSITVEAKADGNQYVSQDGGVQNEKQTTETVIEQDKSTSSTTTNTITIKAEENATAEVTISGVDIDASNSEAAISTGGDGNAKIELDGENSLKSGYSHAGLEKSNGGKLTISDKDNNGSLTAVGGDWAAGIGGNYKNNGSNIEITGGNVKAEGGDFGAGIGGGYSGNGSNIKISGGNVEAIGGSFAAGIGGGDWGSGSDITIDGSNVTATGGGFAAGIGGGDSGSGTNIAVSGDAQVKVSGGDGASDIGSGKNDGGKGEITPDTSKLGENGSISYFAPWEDKTTANPERLLHKTDSGVETHEKVSIKSKTDPTCTQPGSIIYRCSCGKEVTQVIPALNHELKHYDAKAATCTEKGWKEYDACTRCNYSTYVEVPIDSSNHDLKHHDAKKATCTEKGWDAYDTCTYVEKPINPDNHDLEHHDGKEPTCTEDGWEEYDTCKRKGCTYTTYQKINALNHSFTKYVYQNDATCLEDGKEIAHCDHTGCTETDVRTAVGTALGHRFTDYVYNGDADYASDGTETAQCDHGCGETDTRPAEGTRLAIYWVTDEAGKTIAASESRSGSVLTITVNQESASLHGYTAGLRALQAEGIGTIVFVTNGAVSTFTLASVPTGAAYCLTHTGAEVTFTLDGADISAILQ